MARTRTVAGKTYDYDDFLLLLVQTLSEIGKDRPMGDATIQEVTEVWGDPYWSSSRGKQELSVFIAQRLRNKDKTPIQKIAPGRYAPMRTALEQGVSAAQQYETALLQDMRENGGFMWWRDIRRAFGVDPRKGSLKEIAKTPRPGSAAERRRVRTERAYEDRDWSTGDDQLRRSISRSNLIRHDTTKHGLYHLRLDLLAQLPLEGRWAPYLFWMTYRLLGLRDAGPLNDRDRQSVRPNLVRFYERVGIAYQTARRLCRIELDQVIDDPEAGELLVKIAAQHPFRAGYLERFEPGWVDRGMDNYPRAFEIGDKPADWPKVVLGLFEHGEEHAHILARSALHRALGRLYGVDPVWMSRGLLVAQPDQHKVGRHQFTDPPPLTERQLDLLGFSDDAGGA